jgi:hypothetical protein
MAFFNFLNIYPISYFNKSLCYSYYHMHFHLITIIILDELPYMSKNLLVIPSFIQFILMKYFMVRYYHYLLNAFRYHSLINFCFISYDHSLQYLVKIKYLVIKTFNMIDH